MNRLKQSLWRRIEKIKVAYRDLCTLLQLLAKTIRTVLANKAFNDGSISTCDTVVVIKPTTIVSRRLNPSFGNILSEKLCNLPSDIKRIKVSSSGLCNSFVLTRPRLPPPPGLPPVPPPWHSAKYPSLWGDKTRISEL